MLGKSKNLSSILTQYPAIYLWQGAEYRLFKSGGFTKRHSFCAQKLLNKEVDLGLVPVAIIPKLNEAHIISDYCIGAVGKVKSVLMVSDVPLEEIKNIYLDYHSRTSVRLCQLITESY